MRISESAAAAIDRPPDDLTQPGVRDRRPAFAALAICAVFYVWVYLGLSLAQDFTSYGDPSCDQRAVIGAREFLKVGFAKLAFTQVEDAGPEVGLPGWYYYRHPSGGVVFLALAQKAGLTLHQARAIPLLFTAIGVFGLFLFFREATGRPWLAVAGTAFYASLAPVWLLADSYQFYSYALFVKGIAFWLIAAGVRRSGAARHARFAFLALTLVLAVNVFGLETIPAIALMAVFLPLFLGGGPAKARVRTAFACGSWAAAGILVGTGLHILNVAAIDEFSVGEIIRVYLGSLSGRSLDQKTWVALDHPYPVEVLRRCAVYMPQIVVAAAGAIIWILLRLLGGARHIRVPEWRLLLATLLSEGLYFVVMQGHVREHAHTAVHVAVFMATLGMVSVATIREGFAWTLRDTAFAGLAAGSLVIAALIAPLQSWGSLRSPGSEGNPLPGEIPQLDQMTARLPRDAFVAVVCRDWEQFPLGYALARHDLAIIGVPRGMAALDLARRIDRPYFALATDGGSVEGLRLLHRMAPVIAENGRFTLYGLANYDPALVSKTGARLSVEAIRGGRLISPLAEELERAKVNYILFGPEGHGLWMLALNKPVTSPTVIRFEVPEGERPEHVREVRASLRYDVRPGLQQPVLTASLRAWTQAGASNGPAGTATATLAPGRAADCRVELRDPGTLFRVELELQIAPGETRGAGAVVNVTAIRYVN